MFTLSKTKTVEAAHQLPHHDGKCKGLHGHSWKVTVEVRGDKLHLGGPKRGMLFDYYDLGQIMKEHVDVLDHRFLNDLFKNPTSEVIAEALFGTIAPLVEEKSQGFAELSRVIVSETESSQAEFSR